MKIIPYNAQFHAASIEKALENRILDISYVRNLPQLGLICQDSNHFIAAGFIRHVEGGFGMLDSLITNPNITPAIRDKALDRLVGELLIMAKEHGYKQIIAFTHDKNTLERSFRHGFGQLAHTVISIDLTSAQGA